MTTDAGQSFSWLPVVARQMHVTKLRYLLAGVKVRAFGRAYVLDMERDEIREVEA